MKQSFDHAATFLDRHARRARHAQGEIGAVSSGNSFAP
jgi:hypothetical protein